MSKPSPPRWVSICRPATAMMAASGGVAGGGWEYPESPPTPPRRKWHTCRLEKWGSLRHAPLFNTESESASLPVPQPPPSNPPSVPHVSPSQISNDASVFGNRPLDSPHIGGDPAASEDVIGKSNGANDRPTQACAEANLEVKIQMKKMDLYFFYSDDDY